MPTTDAVRCPKCDNTMWDNRATKKNPRAPDYRCRDRDCDGIVWPPKPDKHAKGGAQAHANAKQAHSAGPHVPGLDEEPALITSEELKEAALKKLGALHKRCLQFVLANEVPLLDAPKVGASPEAVSALTAQLFIAAKEMGLHR